MANRDSERYFDRRTYERHLRRGHVTQADYDSFVDGLPDVVENIKAKDDGGDDDGYDEHVGTVPEGSGDEADPDPEVNPEVNPEVAAPAGASPAGTPPVADLDDPFAGAPTVPGTTPSPAEPVMPSPAPASPVPPVVDPS